LLDAEKNYCHLVTRLIARISFFLFNFPTARIQTRSFAVLRKKEDARIILKRREIDLTCRKPVSLKMQFSRMSPRDTTDWNIFFSETVFHQSLEFEFRWYESELAPANNSNHFSDADNRSRNVPLE